MNMSSSSSSTLQLWKEYRIPLVCMALGIATLSLILSAKSDNDSQQQGDSKKKSIKKAEKTIQDMEQDPALPELDIEVISKVVEKVTSDQRPLHHKGLKKEEFRKLPKVIRKKPKKKQAELDASANSISSGCCGGKNKPEGDNSTGCCGGKNKGSNNNTSSHACACSSTSTRDLAPTTPAQLDPSLLPLLAEPIKVFYSSVTGTAKLFAQQFVDSAVTLGLRTPTMINIVDYDTEDFLAESALCIFILSTYNVEGPNDWFLKWLEDTRFDWRVQKESLNKLKFSVFGLGDSAYGDEFCNGPRSADKWFGQMGAQRVWPLGEGDKNADQGGAYKQWNNALLSSIMDPNQSHVHEVYFSSDDEDGASASEHDDDEDVDENGERIKKTKEEKLGLPTIDGGDLSEGEMVDVEDMGNVARKIRQAKEEKALDEEAYANQNSRAKRTIGETKDGKAIKPRDVREMVSPLLYKSLTKQGYKIIGSHSGVKICRWTKAALRGRGFCYKHSFYGIQSHLCMETTPSLACANKCVFW
ncbi:S-adenosyl-L-methionine-dependent tRNA 4-demethylwyosine synthase [Entomortierella beljakovae]|nr:S-adenosyl-L-methionine-dependent tRNA 4-demethylwyosine synthase [Entomortierella beljakovae]